VTQDRHNPTSFGQYLRALRGDLMFREISARCGMGPGALSSIEGDNWNDIKLSTIPKLARGYGVSVEEMTRVALHFYAGQPWSGRVARRPTEGEAEHAKDVAREHGWLTGDRWVWDD
jgi:transcriptional regulator with XRE-family HTH domain